MTRIKTFAVLATLLSITCNAGMPKGAGALLGSWEFDSGRSMFDGAMPYRSGTYTFSNTSEGVRVVAHIIEGNGQVLHFEYVDRQDGTFAHVTGNPFYDSESTQWSNAGYASRSERRNGTITGKTDMTISSDGKSFTASARRTLPDGRLYISKIVWQRR
jgi:hypothetical protein